MDGKNLMIFMSDGHDPRYLGSAGHPLMHTPALDRLAERGTLFSNAYTACPICVPSRASFATGRHVHETGCWDNAHAYNGEIPGWAQLVQQAGHPIEAIGKMHFRRAEDPLGFDRQHEPMHIADGVGMVWGAIRDPFPSLNPPFQLIKRVGVGVSNYNLYDRRIANHASEWLKARANTRDEPWVLYVGFVAPHPPFLVPREYLDRYPLDDVPLPKAHDMPAERLHPWVRAQGEFIAQDGFFRDDEERRLAYVGLTRARQEARISYAANRCIYNQWQNALPSRFIGELPAQNIEVSTDTPFLGGRTNGGFEFNSPRRAGHARDGTVIEGGAWLVPSAVAKSTYAAGTRVFHKKFGYGRVLAADGNKLEVEFEKAGTKKIIDTFVEPV